MIDERFDQALKITKSIVGSANLVYTNILITSNNLLAIFVRDTSIYLTTLEHVTPGFDVAFQYNVGSSLSDLVIPDPYLLIDLSNKLNRYLFYTDPKYLVAEELDIREREDIEQLISMKSSEGVKFYKMRDRIFPDKIYYIPFFSGLTSLNKGDTFGLRVYNLTDGYFLVEYNIFKKKIKRSVKIYIKIFNLN